jgi:hypothetical protein
MIEQTVEASRRLVVLRDRLAELEAETAQVRAQIADCMRQLSGTVGSLVAPLAELNHLATQILTVMHQQPEAAFSPADIAGILGDRSERERIRITLFRLMRAGRVKRIAHGRYRVVP